MPFIVLIKKTNMNTHHAHHHHSPASAPVSHANHQAPLPASRSELLLLAVSTTFHCLIGCGIGEVAGMIISTAIGLNNLDSIVLSVILGVIAGLGLGVRPLLKHGFTLSNALKTVIIGEGVSIVVMEAFEIMTQMAIPGVMDAHLTEPLFWSGMIAALAAGFVAALPVNYVFVKRGIRHQH